MQAIRSSSLFPGAFALLLALAACARQGEAPVAAEAESAAVASRAPAVPMPDGSGETAVAAADAAAPEASPPAATATVPAAVDPLQSAVLAPGSERPLIRTAKLEFRTRDVYAAALAIEDLAARYGGFAARNDIRAEIERVERRANGDGGVIELATYTTRGHLQLRVPSANAQTFLRGLATQVEFLDQRDFEAVDAQFELLRQQLAQARHQQAQRQLADIAAGPGKAGERAAAVTAGAEAQGQRDEALIARRTFEDRVAFATVELSLYQAPRLRRTEQVDLEALARREGPGFFARLGHALAGGWRGLLEVALALAALWPLWLVVAAAFAAVRVRRRYRSKAT